MNAPHIERDDVAMILDLLNIVLIVLALWQVGAWLSNWSAPL